MPTRFFHVDSFADKWFAGNPAGVCILNAQTDEAWMADIAKEMNLPATAFLRSDKDGYWLRWFTASGSELALCGHGTLAAAHILWKEGLLDGGVPAVFHTMAGELSANRRGEWIELDFPARSADATEAPPQLAEALDADLKFVGKNNLDYLVEVADEPTLRALQPHMDLLRRLPARAVIATARGSGTYDFVSRFFAPSIGIDEDAVTGSAHTALGPYWTAKLNKDELLAFQASARGGVLKIRIHGARVFISGQAITVARGELSA